MATECCKKLQGIPQPGTPFKCKNLRTKRFIFNAPNAKPFLRDKDTNRMEVFFELERAEGTASSGNPERYIIKSVNTNLALTDNSKADGSGKDIDVEQVNRSNKNQIWSIEPTTKFSAGYYRIRNLATNGFLLNGPADGNYLRTVANITEYDDQTWTFIFTEGLGIPPVHSELRIRNDKTSRFVFADDKQVFVQDQVSTLKEQVFVLLPSKLRPESYLIQSLNTGAYLEDVSDGNGGVAVTTNVNINHSSLRQVWSLLPGTTYLGTYRIRNCSSQGCLVNGSSPQNNLQTWKGSIEYQDQCWTFLETCN